MLSGIKQPGADKIKPIIVKKVGKRTLLPGLSYLVVLLSVPIGNVQDRRLPEDQDGSALATSTERSRNCSISSLVLRSLLTKRVTSRP